MLRLPAALLALLSLGLAGCFSSDTASTPTSTSEVTHIDLLDNKYQPNSATLKLAQAVHFENKGTRDHTVTIYDDDGHVLRDRTLKPGEKDEYKFPHTGHFHVLCRFHNGMEAALELAE